MPQGKVARIDKTYYDTLQDAFDAVTKNNTQTEVILLANISENVQVEGNKNIVLNLNNKTITNVNKTIQKEIEGESYEGLQSAIEILSSATVEMKGGTITSNYGSLVENYGTLTLTNGTYNSSSTYPLFWNFGTATITGGTISSSISNAILNEGNATITGGTINSSEQFSHNGEAGTINNFGEITINGGNVTSSYSIAVNNPEGTLKINGPVQISSNGEPSTGPYAGIGVYNHYSAIISSGSFFGSSCALLSKSNYELTVTGGTFTSTGEGYAIYCDKDADGATINVSGATVNGKTYRIIINCFHRDA
ncbi:MAG TPA: hypothetical protein DEP51_07460 [Clostridiales bacterium]|nr:hypothetical protein [Clostridiales bacterium]